MNQSLHYADLHVSGYSRRRYGRGFQYLSPKGRRVKSENVLSYFRSLVIPPAWESVWINQQRDAHILCTGLDKKSRKQYIYHPEWQND